MDKRDRGYTIEANKMNAGEFMYSNLSGVNQCKTLF